MKKIRYFVLLIIIILLVKTLLFPTYIKRKTTISQAKYSLGVFEKNDVYEGEFTPSLLNLTKIGVRVATFSKKNTHGSVMFELYSNDSLVTQKEIELKDIEDNDFVYLNIPKQKTYKKDSYRLKVYYSKYYSDCYFTIWGDKTPHKVNNVLKNNEYINMSLFYALYGYSRNNTLSIYLILTLLIYLIYITLSGGDVNEKK